MTLNDINRVLDAFRPYLAPGEEIAVFDTVLADFSVGFPHMFVKAPLHWRDIKDKAQIAKTLVDLRELRGTFAKNARARAAEKDTIKGHLPLAGIDATVEAVDAGTGEKVFAEVHHVLPADIAGAEIAALLWEERHAHLNGAK